MGSLRSSSFGWRTDPPLPKDTRIAFNLSPITLMLEGLNISVIVSTATAFKLQDNLQPLKTAQIEAHFDTGANITSIDIGLARQLNLIPVGQSPSNTAAGLRVATNFIIDLNFPGTNLQPFKNLQISSCELSSPSMSVPFKMLLGRDVMSRWNIIWDGPTSTVIICD
jgi:hypothetical protein